MKTVLLDGYTINPGDLSWAWLYKYGDADIYERTPADDDEIIRRIGDADAVLTSDCPIDRTVIDSCPKLKYISALATGYNFVDTDYAASRSIPVTNIPAYGTAAVGQAAIALLLEICHHTGHHSEAVHNGRWGECQDYCFWDYPVIELAGKTIGIIGFGRIGQTTGRIAKAMGMKVLATGSRPTDAGREIAEYADLDTLLGQSDVVAMHCPLLPETEGMINKETISKMKDGVIFINNSRGRLVAERDLADALNSGKIYAAGLDVVSDEPISADNPLLSAKNCFITPHMSWAAKECRTRIMECSENNLKAFLEGKPVNVVN